MTSDSAAPTDRDRQMDEVLGGYFEAVEAGRAPDRSDLLARYPSLAAELEAFFADEDRLDRFAAPFRPAARAALADTLARDLPGRVFGPFTLRRELGRGAMGVVYEAEQEAPRRTVALKLIRDATLATRADVARFTNEAQAAAQLDHPNIVPIYEVGTVEGQPYFAMKYLAGGSLADHLDRFRADPRAAARLVATVARAVHHAHQRGVLHRDLKPSNILIADGGIQDGHSEVSRAAEPCADDARQPTIGNPQSAIPYVADFGLAKRIGGDANLTQTGLLVGTPNYMAPEQASGMKGAVTTATDVYGLGAVLYALLTGRPPFRGDSVLEVLEQVKGRDPDPPSRLGARTDRDLDTVCLTCLAKDPGKRYASATTLADDLERWLAGEPIRARPVDVAERLWRWCRRNRALAGLYATLIIVLLASVAAAFAYQRQQFAQELARVSGERRTRAAALADALETADIAGVPAIVRQLESVRAEAEPMLRERYAAAAGRSEWLRYALALLPVDPGRVDELLAAVPTARAEELLVLRDALRPYAAQVTALWPRLADAAPGPRLRFAGLLAAFLPADDRWQTHAAALAGQLVRINPLELAAWWPAFEPLQRPLTPALLDIYRTTQARVKAGELAAPRLVQTATQFDLAAALLARAATDQPVALAELLHTADARHYASFFESARAHAATVARAMKATLTATADHAATDDALETFAARRAAAAATLVRLGESGPAWELLRHTPDPTVRSFLIHGLAPRSVDPVALIRRYGDEPDVSARRALLLSLGEYEPATLPAAERGRLTERLLEEFRDHPDAGLHGAIDWLLRQKWGRAADLDQITTGLRGRPADGRGWFVNGKGQTFSVVRGPAEFTFGSPSDEPGREEGDVENQRRERIGYSYAVAVREVTREGYREFNANFQYGRQSAREPDGPVNRVSWYEAAAYCRWLSEQEGVPLDQMCYPEIKDIKEGMKIPEDFASRTGYRLPTAVEWECACRAGTITARPYGRGTELLDRYAWSLGNCRGQLWPCGQLKPNDLGLFDTLGNALEWCQEASLVPTQDERHYVLSDGQIRRLRGGSFNQTAACQRSTYRGALSPYLKFNDLGIRPVRTVH